MSPIQPVNLTPTAEPHPQAVEITPVTFPVYTGYYIYCYSSSEHWPRLVGNLPLFTNPVSVVIIVDQ